MNKLKTCRKPLDNLMERLQKLEIILVQKQRTIYIRITNNNNLHIQVMSTGKRTAEVWSVSGNITFSQVGSKLCYYLTAVISMLISRHKPFNS